MENEETNTTRGDYEKQWAHVERSHLIRADKEFIVVIDKAGRLDWETSPQYDAKPCDDEEKDASIFSQASMLEENPSDCLTPSLQLSFKRLIGEALVLALNGNYDGAQTMLQAAATFFRDRSEETSRRWYLTASACMTLPFILIGIVSWLARTTIVTYEGDTALWLLLAMVAGALGALLSVIWRSGKLSFACSAGKQLHYLEGASRIWAGALIGILTGLAVRYGIVLAPLAHGAGLHGIMLLTAFSAGSGERLATSIISEFDSTQVTVSAAKTKPTRKPK